MANLLARMVTMGFLIAAVFFVKFWTRTCDALFAIFAVTFLLLALHHAVLIGSELPRSEQGCTYLLRLIAFSLLALAIVYKNMGRASRPD